MASLEFTGFAGKSSAATPMVESGYENTVFPQVAQTTDGSIYTGLAIMNPNDTMVTVTVQAYTSTAAWRGRRVDLDPRAREIDLLSGATFFGPDFAQTKGRIRVRDHRQGGRLRQLRRRPRRVSCPPSKGKKRSNDF